MHEITIRIPDEAFTAAEMRARQEGFGSTEIYLSTLVTDTVTFDPNNYDHLFTPNVLATIDRGAQEVRDGKGMPRHEVKAYLATKRSEWLENHAG